MQKAAIWENSSVLAIWNDSLTGPIHRWKKITDSVTSVTVEGYTKMSACLPNRACRFSQTVNFAFNFNYAKDINDL